MRSLILLLLLGQSWADANVPGTIKSPNYPENYGNNEDVTFPLEVDPGSRVKLDFTSFDLGFETDCDFDYVKIFDSDGTKELGIFCGSLVPPPIISSGNNMTVVFHSGDSVTRKGFLATWRKVSGVITSPNFQSRADANVLRQVTPPPNGAVMSKNYPHNYGDNEDITTALEVDPETRIQLVFSVFDLQFQTDCNFDYLMIFDSDGTTSLGKFCGPFIPPTIISNSNTMTLNFHSDGTINKKGYFGLQSVLPGLITSQKTITSPNYPENHGNNENVSFPLEVDPGSRIKLDFTTFDLEYDKHCHYDYVKVLDSDGTTELAKRCGSSLPPYFISSGNKMTLFFHSDYSVTRKGFSAIASVLPENGTIKSPNHPENYGNNRDITFLLEVDPGSRIKLVFTSFDLEFQSDCNWDYVKVLDTDGTTSLGKFCGPFLPPTIISSGNKMTVVFHSDGSVTYQGFSATWSTVSGATSG